MPLLQLLQNYDRLIGLIISLLIANRRRFGEETEFYKDFSNKIHENTNYVIKYLVYLEYAQRDEHLIKLTPGLHSINHVPVA